MDDGNAEKCNMVTVNVDPVNDLFGIELESTLQNTE